MTFTGLPSAAAWRHQHARDGFEVAFFSPVPDGCVIRGSTVAVEADELLAVRYRIDVTPDWLTRRVEAASLSRDGEMTVVLEHDGAGNWQVDGVSAPHLFGCLDVDFESSALTNALPVRRLGLAVSAQADAPAAYVRAVDLAVERLDQEYLRLSDAEGERYLYRAPAFEFTCELAYDGAGLVTSYPGIAVRAY